MADRRTRVTELTTGLGMLGLDSVEAALDSEPRSMVSVSPEMWAELRDLHTGGALRAEFAAAWANGQAFLNADGGLRGRRPVIVEWKGSVKAPGDEVVPADLRIDHVYFVSCKYLSKILYNVSPAFLFERNLAGAQGSRSPGDWYSVVAQSELADLYQVAIESIDAGLPASPSDLTSEDRALVAARLKGRWRPEVREQARAFARVVAERTATRWTAQMSTEVAKERLLWRLLRIGSAPYFVLGTDRATSLRLRIQTPWDWRQHYRLREFMASASAGEQPVVAWAAEVEDRRSGALVPVEGHIEIRWSHGKFCGAPEAKVYLDTPHHRVPGYVAIA